MKVSETNILNSWVSLSQLFHIFVLKYAVNSVYDDSKRNTRIVQEVL